MSMISRFRNAMKSTAGRATLATMIGAGALFGVGRNASAQTVPPPTPQIVTVLGSGNGLNGTRWISELLLGNPNAQDAHGKIVFYNNSPGNDDTNPSTPYTVPKFGTLTLSDPIKAAGLSGNWSVKIVPEDVPVSASARTWNQQDRDGNPATVTQLSQYENATSMDNLLLDGDAATFVLPDSTPQSDGKPAFRANLHYYTEAAVAGEIPQFRVTLFDRFGNYVNETLVTGADHAHGQIVNVVPTLFGRDQAPYDRLLITPNNTPGYRSKLRIIATPVQNNEDLSGFDDGGVQEASVEKLVTDSSFQVAPGTVEANDTFAYRLHVKSAPGTTITGCAITAGIQGYVPGNGTKDFTWEQSSTATVAGSYPLSASCGIKDLNGDHTRTIVGNTMTVNPEKNGYVATYADAKAFIMNNLDLVSTWASHGLFDGQPYAPATWNTAWPLYFDGVANASNPEISTIVFNDIGNTMTGNDVLLKLTNGTQQAIMGLPEQEFDQFRNAVKAKLPQ